MVTSWSFSSLQNYERCAYGWKLSRIDKLPGPERKPDNPMDRGTRIHEEIEHHIRTGEKIPTPLKYQGELIQEVKTRFEAGEAILEENWGHDVDWNLADWDTAWLRAKLDAMIFMGPTEGYIVDWKSGQMFNKDIPHMQQGQLYAACAFNRYQEMETVHVTFAYVDQPKKGNDKVRTYTRPQAEIFQTSFHNRAVRMLNDRDWFPQPTLMACKWCDHGINVGTGACKYDRFSADPVKPELGPYRPYPSKTPALPTPTRNCRVLTGDAQVVHRL